MFAASKETDRYCGGDVEDEVVVELDDSPGTTKKKEVLGFAESLLPVFGQVGLATAGPLTSVTVLLAQLANGQYGKSVLEQLHSDQNMKIMHVNLRFFIRLDLCIGSYHCCGVAQDLLRVSNSPRLESFLLNICMDAPESITKCFSSGFVEEGAGITQASAREQRMCLETLF